MVCTETLEEGPPVWFFLGVGLGLGGGGAQSFVRFRLLPVPMLFIYWVRQCLGLRLGFCFCGGFEALVCLDLPVATGAWGCRSQ